MLRPKALQGLTTVRSRGNHHRFCFGFSRRPTEKGPSTPGMKIFPSSPQHRALEKGTGHPHRCESATNETDCRQTQQCTNQPMSTTSIMNGPRGSPWGIARAQGVRSTWVWAPKEIHRRCFLPHRGNNGNKGRNPIRDGAATTASRAGQTNQRLWE